MNRVRLLLARRIVCPRNANPGIAYEESGNTVVVGFAFASFGGTRSHTPHAQVANNASWATSTNWDFNTNYSGYQ